jgi:hypothetical protein
LNVGAADSLSLWAATKVASRSTITWLRTLPASGR